jgi:hypothetical protein
MTPEGFILLKRKIHAFETFCGYFYVLTTGIP